MVAFGGQPVCLPSVGGMLFLPMVGYMFACGGLSVCLPLLGSTLFCLGGLFFGYVPTISEQCVIFALGGHPSVSVLWDS